MTICYHNPPLRTQDYLCALCVIDELQADVRALEEYRDASPLGAHLLKAESERLRGVLKSAAEKLAAEPFAPRAVIVALLEPIGIDPGCPEHGVGSIRDAFDGCTCPSKATTG